MPETIPWKPILVVGGVGAGAYLLYKWFLQPEKGYKYWYNKLVEDLQAQQEWEADYIAETREVQTMINNLAASGQPVTKENWDPIQAILDEMEKKKVPALTVIWEDINEEDIPNLDPEDVNQFDISDPFKDIWDALGLGVNIIIWGAVGTAILYMGSFVTAAVVRIIKSWKDTFGGGGSGGVSVPTQAGIVEVSGDTVDDAVINAILKFADYVIYQQAVSVVVPNMEYRFKQLPTWQQNIIIEESIMVAALAGRPGWTWAPGQNWLKQFEKPQENETLKYLVIGCVAAYMIIPTLVVAPEALVALEGLVGEGGLVLAPALAA